MREQARRREEGAWKSELGFRCAQIRGRRPPCSVSPPSPSPPTLPPALRLWRVADSCRCLVISECRSIAPQTRAQRRQDSPRPARDSAVSSVGPSAAGPASLSTSPLDRLHLWSLGTDRHGGFCDTWSGTLSGGADLSHSHRWDTASRPLLRKLVGHVRISAAFPMC